jgi:hypothetical protein
LAEGEHTIAFVSWFPFRFAVQSTVSWSFPSNPSTFSFCAVLFELQAAVAIPSSIPVAPSVSITGEDLYEIPFISSSYSWLHPCFSSPVDGENPST